MVWLKKFKFIDVIREEVSVGKALGVEIEKYAGKLDFYDFAENNSLLATLKKHFLIRLIGFKYRKLKSSSLQSLETGRKTEIDFLNGYITEKAHTMDIKTPLNNFLVKLVKEIEAGTRKISYQNFELQFFNQYN